MTYNIIYPHFRYLAITLCALVAAVMPAQAMRGCLPDSVSVSIVTCYPGPDVYELEGHTALHVQGRISDMPIDQAINYGLFDFNSPNFVYRFVKGETDYMVGAMQWEYFVEDYMAKGRRVVERHVPLDSVQTARFLALLAENLLPQNRVYRYNYVKDNCATRPLRLIEKAIGDSIILPQPDNDSAVDATFRDIMTRYHANYPWYQFGIDLALGSGIDYPITAREKSFAPAVLDAQLAGATVGGRPLTDGVTVVNEGHDVVLAPTPWYLSPLAAGWALFFLAVALTIFDLRRRKVSRWFDALYFALMGVAGCVITFLIFVSVHEATSPNWLYLWLNPLCLIVPVCIWLKKCKMVVFSYQIVNFALLLIMVCTWGMHHQHANAAFFPLICADALRAISYVIITRPALGKK